MLFCRMCAIILALHRGIAQLVEYRSPKPWVAGSNPPAPAMLCGQNRSARGKQPFGKPNGGKREISRDFSRFFRPCFFFEKIPIHFAIFSDRKDLNPRKRDFQKKRNRIEQPKGLELATRFQPFRLFCCLHGMFTNRRLQNKSLGVG